MNRDDDRPDPDALLQRVQQAEAAAGRGRLRIYFGSSAGVGKTYAMLAAARKLAADGKDVLVGVVETHGRAETAALLENLPLLPPVTLAYRDRRLEEFDLDGALARKPELILVDELAHSNVPGSRHPKRWQDVEELLAAGIDVFTTLNVQHLESLNDVVGGITGIRVGETLPDTFFDGADEVVLVDIPADELLARLKAGKVYLPAQAERASKNFFRKGNLMALRELALRRTADRIEDDVQAYRAEQSIDKVWKTEAALLCCIGPRPGSEHVVRSAARLASQLNIEWHAVYVETPALQRLPDSERERILRTVKLAQDLGARTAVLTGSDGVVSLVDYARGNNLSKVVVGRTVARAWPLARRFTREFARLAPDVDVIEIGRGGESDAGGAGGKGADTMHGPAPRVAGDDVDERASERRMGYVWAIVTCVAISLVASQLLTLFDLANIVMLFLLTVVLVAIRWGRGPAVLSAFLNVAAFDYFFVPPRFSFAVSDWQYLLTFLVMLVVGLIVGQLTSGLQFQARVASHREARARSLYELSRELSSALETDQVIQIAEAAISRQFRARSLVLVARDEAPLRLPPADAPIAGLDAGTAQWALDHAQPAGLGTDTLPGSAFLYLPLKASMRNRGVLAVQPGSRRLLLIPEQRRQLETFAALVAIALERVHYVEVAQQATLRIESERLRNSLLSALSHDLRTPLAALYGLADTLALYRQLPPAQADIVDAIRAETQRMNALVNNLLDMARIQSGEIRLNLQWQPFEEVVGSALAAMRSALGRHTVRTELARDAPLLNFDAVLIERVLCNLLENAAKYTPPGSEIVIASQVRAADLLVSVSDNGPGLPRGQTESVFDKFTRGERESAKPGVGLGLAICRAIIEEHKGRIWADPEPAAGARFLFTLPLGVPPQMPAVEEPQDGARVTP